MSQNTPLKTFIYTVLALVAFAANSVLCRLALKEGAIDAGTFSVVRLVSGVLVFVALSFILPSSSRSEGSGNSKSDDNTKLTMISAAMLFAYAVLFSFAYTQLDTGTGALVLFGSVQITMILMGVTQGHKLTVQEVAGVLLSFGGLAYLMLPSMSQASTGLGDLTGYLLMTLSGIAWGVYSILGKRSGNPLKRTALNFYYTMPLVVVLALFTVSFENISTEGVMYASLSGAVASALGYTIWYQALNGLGATQASVVQLSVPVIAALGGVVFVTEPVTLRLLLSCLLVLGGIGIVLKARRA